MKIKVYRLIFAGIMLLLCVSCKQNASTLVNYEFAGDELRFSIEYPQDWKYVEYPEDKGDYETAEFVTTDNQKATVYTLTYSDESLIFLVRNLPHPHNISRQLT